MAHCSLAVNVGSFNDPADRQGMAHFLEHMVFMGSTKYPDVNIYSEHIAENGGYCNAYTEFEWTNYFFEVSYAGLEKSLDMIAANMESPCLEKSTMETEINAVESEFKMVQVNDNARSLQVLQNECSSKDNVFCCFAWGNNDSLRGNGDNEALWNQLRKFHAEKYSADRMKLVIQAKTKDNLKELKGWVEKYFGTITNKNFGPQDFADRSLLSPKQLACGNQPYAGNEHEMLFAQSYQDTNILDLTWTIKADKPR